MAEYTELLIVVYNYYYNTTIEKFGKFTFMKI